MGIKINIDGEEIELVNIGKSKAKTYNIYKAPEPFAEMEKPPVIITVHVVPGWKPSMGTAMPGKSSLPMA